VLLVKYFFTISATSFLVNKDSQSKR